MFKNIRQYYQNKIPNLTDVEWQALEDCLEIKYLKKGAHVIREGEVCNHVYFISKGFTRFYINADGKEIAVGFIGANEYISAYESFLTRQPAMENIDALEDTEMLALHYDQMMMLYTNYPVFETFGRKIAEQLYVWISQRCTALLLLTPEQRYIRMIENNSSLPQQIPQYMLATYIGVTPEHLSRLRKKLSVKK